MMKKALDRKKYLEKAAEAVSEGIVMLKNENNALPFDKNSRIALFGRMQLHYCKSGSGSGGMVNVTKVTGIVDGLTEAGACIDKELLDAYRSWDEKNPLDTSGGWGEGPASQEEMPLSDEFVADTAKRCDKAIVIIVRTAGEELDLKNEDGSYRLNDGERAMLRTVRKHFDRMAVLLNTGGIIDMSDIEEISPDSILYVWQGGMTGGIGTAEVLLGKSPSGKLPDTIGRTLEDFPAYKNYGDAERNIYEEDIYVGYRYFETFAPDKVLYPFGFGLSYTTFELDTGNYAIDGEKLTFDVSVKNTGNRAGKETVQLYLCAPSGKLGRPARELCDYKKTKTLAPGEEQVLKLSADMNSLAAYDDSGITGHRFAYVLEEGSYKFYIGTDSRSCKMTAEYLLDKTKEVKKCLSAAAPVTPFKRMKNSGELVYEDVPLMSYNEARRRLDMLPEEIPQKLDNNASLKDVYENRISMKDFIASLSDKDLAAIIRGEGMGSPKVTLGTASAFGGITESLKSRDIPCVCCDDGPSGLRFDCGFKAVSLPSGTMLAASFNDELVTELYSYTGLEMAAHDVDVLLGPGMNIHRFPLNGRNFEYFSEDPLLTGRMGAAVLKGLKSAGSSGTIKHYCGNNQEFHRHDIDSVISERALREIYLKGFETAVKSGYADSVMTTYGSVNGLWTAGDFDLCHLLLREEWGFDGIVMTDWGAKINRRGKPAGRSDFGAMAAAENDLYMVVPDGEAEDGNTAACLENGTLSRAELQRNAEHILRFAMGSRAFARLMGTADEVTITNIPPEEKSEDAEVARFTIGEHDTIDGSEIPTEAGTEYPFLLNVKAPGKYRIKITASSEASETAQIPVTLFSMGSANAVFTWSGTGGKPVTFETELWLFSGFVSMRLYFAQSGLKIHSIGFDVLQLKDDPLVI